MSQQDPFAEGTQCLLRVMDQQFWVRVTEAGEEAICVSFPGHDYPIEGMQIELEIHEESGYRRFSSHMLDRAPSLDDGIILSRPREQQQLTHRSSIRVDTDLPISVKDQTTIRKHPGTLINLSQGGALFTTEAPFNFESTIELTLTLPGEPAHTLLGQVRHVDSVRGTAGSNIGVRFITVDEDAAIAIERFIIEQLRSMYPSM